MTSNHIVSVTFQPKPEHRETFAKVMLSVKSDLPKVQGCRSVRVLRHLDEPATFLLIEDWESAELHEAHIARLVASGDWAALEQMLAVAPSTTVLKHV